MLATISPHSSCYEDTVNTLRYALKAKAIVCHVKVNETKTTVVVDAIRKEMELLQEKLRSIGDGNDSAQGRASLSSDLTHRELELRQAMEEVEKSEEQKKHLKMALDEHESALSSLQTELEPKLQVWKSTQELTEVHQEVEKLHQVQTQQLQREETMGNERTANIQYELKRRHSLIKKTEMKRRAKSQFEEQADYEGHQAWATFFQTVVEKTKIKRETDTCLQTRHELSRRKRTAERSMLLLTTQLEKVLYDVSVLRPQGDQLEEQHSRDVIELDETVDDKLSAIRRLVSQLRATEEDIRLQSQDLAIVEGGISVLSSPVKKPARVSTPEGHADEYDLTVEEEVELLEALHKQEADLLDEASSIKKQVDDKTTVDEELAKEETTLAESSKEGAVLSLQVDIEALELELSQLGEAHAELDDTDKKQQREHGDVKNQALSTKRAQGSLGNYLDRRNHVATKPSETEIGRTRALLARSATRLTKAPELRAHGKVIYPK